MNDRMGIVIDFLSKDAATLCFLELTNLKKSLYFLFRGPRDYRFAEFWASPLGGQVG
jgi:hypothetical protein